MMDNKIKKEPIKSYRDLDVYQNSYKASILVITKIILNLPKTERFDLADQMSRASKAVPRLIAEGYAKKHQNKGFQKYLDDAMGESNEMVVCLSHCRDLYSKYFDDDIILLEDLIDLYDKIGRQLYKLSMVWRNFKRDKQ